MIRSKEFWEQEKLAPLLTLEENYFKENTEAVVERAEKWRSTLFPEKFQQDPAHKRIEGEIDENYVRIFEKDADRTFKTKENREMMIALLSDLFRDFGDYSQSLGYVCSFLLLLLPKEDTKEILEHLNFDPKYVPGYWKAQAVDFGRDAYVFQALLERFHPEVAQHLLQCGIMPNTYCQKWFSGLCIHVLPFETLMDFFGGFLEEGSAFSFRFGLALVERLKDRLLASKSPVTLFELLRLDYKNPDVPKDIGREILQIAASDAYKDLGDLEALRKKAYEEKIRPQMEAAHRRHAEIDSDDEIVFSDEEEEDKSEKSGDESEREDSTELTGEVKKLSIK